MTSPGASVCVCVCGPLLRHQSVQLWAGSGAWLTSRGIVINHFNAALLVSCGTSIWAADNVRKGDWLNIARTDEEDISRLLTACVDGSYSETKPKQNKEIPQNNEDLVETSCKCHSTGGLFSNGRSSQRFRSGSPTAHWSYDPNPNPNPNPTLTL